MEELDCAIEEPFDGPEGICARAGIQNTKPDVSMQVTIPKLENGNRFIVLKLLTPRQALKIVRASYLDSFLRTIDAKDYDCAPISMDFDVVESETLGRK